MQYLVYVLLFGISIFLQFLSICNSVSIPPYVHLCKRNDPDLSNCIIKTFNEIRPYLKKGIPEMNIPPGDPIEYYNVSASTGETKSLHFRAKAWNQVATGLLNAELRNITFDFDKVTCSCSLYFPFVMFRGDYNIEGKILLFDINSTGIYVLNATNTLSNAELSGKYIEKDGKKYFECTNIKTGLDLGHVSIHYTNLIPGNEILTNTLNEAINENIFSLYEELAPIVDDVFSGLAKKYFNNVFSLFSVNELFPEN